MADTTTNSFSLLKRFLTGRLFSPVGHFSFWVYLFLAVVGFSGLGVWVEVYRFWRGTGDMHAVLTALYTYFPAVAVSAALQLDLDENDRKYVRSFAFIAFVLTVGMALMHAAELFGRAALVFGILGSVMSTLLWWIGNGANPSFRDFDANAPLGGPPSTPAGGDTSGYRT